MYDFLDFTGLGIEKTKVGPGYYYQQLARSKGKK